MPGTLKVIGTPIGNLGDASPRVREALASCDCVLCEDTRVTGKLLAALDIHVSLARCDENVIAARAPEFVARLEAGETLGFASDAGMPCISDPGAVLVDAALQARDERGADIRIEVIPGPTAVATALAASGFPNTNFYFGGFFPRKAGERAKLLADLAPLDATLVFYESPHRIISALKAVAEQLPARRVCVCRELTKLHEEVLRGTAAQLADTLEQRGEVKGEVVLLIEAGTGIDERPDFDEQEAKEYVAGLLQAGEPASAMAKICAKHFGVPKHVVYDALAETTDESVIPSAVVRAIMNATNNT